MLLLARFKNQLKQEKTRRIQKKKVEQVAGLTAAANAVVNAVNLEYNDWSGDAAAKTEKDPNSRYKHLKYVESSVVIHCYVYRRRFFDLSFITS